MFCSPLDPVAKAAIELQLADAQKKYHMLMTGMAPRVIVDQNGERVEFNAANSTKLSSYIMTLQQQLGIPVNCAGMAPSAPAQFIF